MEVALPRNSISTLGVLLHNRIFKVSWLWSKYASIALRSTLHRCKWPDEWLKHRPWDGVNNGLLTDYNSRDSKNICFCTTSCRFKQASTGREYPNAITHDALCKKQTLVADLNVPFVELHVTELHISGSTKQYWSLLSTIYFLIPPLANAPAILWEPLMML